MMDKLGRDKSRIKELLYEIWRYEAQPIGDKGLPESPNEKQFNEIEKILDSMVSDIKVKRRLEYRNRIRVYADIIKQLTKTNDDED